MHMPVQVDIYAHIHISIVHICILFIELVILYVVCSPVRALACACSYTHICMCVAILRPLALRCAPPSGVPFGRVSRVFVRVREPVCLLTIPLPLLYVYRCISYFIVTLNSFYNTVNEVSALSLLLFLPATRLSCVARVRGVEIVQSRATILFYILPTVGLVQSSFFSSFFYLNNLYWLVQRVLI